MYIWNGPPIIAVAALLKLVEWTQQRQASSKQGGKSCLVTTVSESPPAPNSQHNPAATDSTLGSNSDGTAASGDVRSQSYGGPKNADTSDYIGGER